MAVVSANVSKICGLKPINQPYGNMRVTYYRAATGTGDFYLNMPVDLDANGRVVPALEGVQITTGAGALLLGTAVSFFDPDFSPVATTYVSSYPDFATATTAGVFWVGVTDDPNQEYLIEEETGGTALTAQAAHAGCAFIHIATSGNTSTGLSNVCLDRSTVGTGTDLALRLVGLYDKEDNIYGNYAKWIVKINRHRLNVQEPGGAVGESLLL